jgi:hypothetical protein
MNGMPPAERTVFLELDLIGCCPLVLGGRIVSSLAVSAGKGDDVSHRSTPSVRPPLWWEPILSSKGDDAALLSFDDVADDASSHGPSTLTNGKP